MRKALLLGLVGLVGLLGISTVALADRGKGKGNRNATAFAAKLDGWQEAPSQVTTGKGRFTATIVSASRIDFTLRYDDLESATVNQAHIHIGSFHESGGIAAWLCGSVAASTQPACAPGPDGTVTGSILADDIVPQTPDQGVAAGEFADLIRAMRKGESYANVHTTRAPGGEIRGQIKGVKNDDKDDDDR